MEPVKYVVYDTMNDQAWGPYDSSEEAEADLTAKANKGTWIDVLEVATHTGWLTDGSHRELRLVELQSKEANLAY